LRNLEQSGERNRGLYILKSRGMAHSNQIREFQLSRKGIELIEVALADGVVLTGTARLQHAARQRAENQLRRDHALRLRRSAERKKRATEAQIAQLRSALQDELDDLQQAFDVESSIASRAAHEREELARSRMLGGNNTSRRQPQALPPLNRSSFSRADHPTKNT